MTTTIDLINEMMSQVAGCSFYSGRPSEVAVAHACDGCGQSTPDVDLYAENSETGEEIWICISCGES